VNPVGQRGQPPWYIKKNKEDITELIGKEKLMDWLLFIDNPNSEYAKLVENADEAIGRAHILRHLMLKRIEKKL
jgi:hypothetical protein